MKKLSIIVIAALGFWGCNSETGKPKEEAETFRTDFTTLRRDLDSIAAGVEAKFALGYINIETGDTFSYKGEEHQPMQSTVKFPLALLIMQQIDAGKLKIDQKVPMTAEEMGAGARSPLRDAYGAKAVGVPIHDMLYYMIAMSDNVTCNKFTEMVGGVKALDSQVHSLGVKGFGLVAAEGKPGAIDFSRPYENWCEPRDMAGLLAKFYTGGILSKTSTDTLRSMMERAQRERIKGQLPKETVVAHKTGTSGSENGITTAVNDIGIVTLPNSQHLVLAIYVTEVQGDMEAGEAIIARIAKAAFDHAVKRAE
ncbi:MAG TPA: class A beta-lactamase [Flavipsychrobacter sp.]|nr:class A beta-lactamase [Flavipsychrobacter sp.]